MRISERKKSYSAFVISNFITLPVIGWFVGGLVPTLVGFCLALLIDLFFIKWRYELTWKDIDLALNNLYKYGRSPSEICFRVGDRRIFVYRDEKDDTQRGQPPSTYIRMAVRIPLVDWSGLLTEKDLDDLFHKYGGMAMTSSNRGPKCYDIFIKSRLGVEACRELLKELFEKAVGGLRPDIMASSNFVLSYKNVWIDHSQEENS
jgi:hypothetical protein